jgi:hypothetical protein
MMFRSPGWYPEEKGGIQFPTPVDDKTYQKFDFWVDLKKGRYLFLQFLILLSFTAFFLFTFASYDNGQKWIGSLVIVASLMILGGLFENRKWAKLLEFFRLNFYTLFFWYAARLEFMVVCLSLAVVFSVYFYTQLFKISSSEN